MTNDEYMTFLKEAARTTFALGISAVISFLLCSSYKNSGYAYNLLNAHSNRFAWIINLIAAAFTITYLVIALKKEDEPIKMRPLLDTVLAILFGLSFPDFFLIHGATGVYFYALMAFITIGIRFLLLLVTKDKLYFIFKIMIAAAISGLVLYALAKRGSFSHYEIAAGVIGTIVSSVILIFTSYLESNSTLPAILILMIVVLAVIVFILLAGIILGIIALGMGGTFYYSYEEDK